ncbi:MAG: NUDIX domain-containing protein [Clostridia bacterium]|nr:NUDIX domain-containing protein [Clostridia bacterium]
MERLLLPDGGDYADDMPEIVRIAVRGIIFTDGKLLLVEDGKNEVKLPGGGREEGETDIDTLVREVREETGRAVAAETVRPFGYIEEKRKSLNEDMIWHQFSRLYFCGVTGERTDTEYSENEKRRGMRTAAYTIDEAIAKNRAMLDRIGALAWNQRVYRTLLLIKEYLEKGIG